MEEPWYHRVPGSLPGGVLLDRLSFSEYSITIALNLAETEGEKEHLTSGSPKFGQSI